VHHEGDDDGSEDAVYLLEAYDLFQRLEIAAEIVLGDLRAAPSAAVPAGQSHSSAISFRPRHMWSLLRREIQKVVQNLYTELKIRQLAVPPTLARAIISQQIRCVQHSAYRDVRDFVIFRSIRQTVHYFFQRFERILL
jgi:hypothetical protein